MLLLTPKESGKLIAANAVNVQIKLEGIKKLGEVLVEELELERLKPENFNQISLHPNSNEPHALEWLFLVDTLNFCFWHNENDEGWKVEGYSGYFALCAAINRALNENIDILNPRFYSHITENQLKKILRSDTDGIEAPLLSDRVKCLHEIGTVLVENFEGSFKNLIKLANYSAVKLLELITTNFKCFKDENVYRNQKVAFYKRAQILIGDIWACFKGEDFGYFKDIDEITMFADYRVPQTLLWYGVFEYSSTLEEKLKNNHIFHNGDVEEQEIRGCSIHAVELLKEFIKKKSNKKINSILIDHFLWDFRRKHAKEIEEKTLPFHKVLSIYY